MAATASRDVRANPGNRQGRYTETPDYIAMVRRMIRGAGRRVGDMDIAELPALNALHGEVEAVLRAAARDLHAKGCSWGEIGRAMGCYAPGKERQAAYYRFGASRSQLRGRKQP